MIISRRFFLIGTAAAVAAVSLPPVVEAMLPPQAMILTGEAGSFARRLVFAIEARPNWDAAERDVGSQINVSSSRRGRFLNMGLANRGWARWIATPFKEFVMLPDEVMFLDWVGCPRSSRISVFYEDFAADGTSKGYEEWRAFPDGPSERQLMGPPPPLQDFDCEPEYDDWE
jgi:hypothetical protein